MADELDDTAQAETEAPVTESSSVEQTETPSSEKEIMIPKSRFDEALAKARQKPKDEKPNVNLEEVVARQLAPIKVKLETQEVLQNYPDFKEHATGALSLIQKNPSLSLEEAYKLTKYDSLQSKAKEEGKNEAYQTIEKKSQSFESSGPKKTTRPLDEMLRDKTVPLEEIKKMLPHA